MNISIIEDSLLKKGITLKEAVTLLAFWININPPEDYKSLVKKGLIEMVDNKPEFSAEALQLIEEFTKIKKVKAESELKDLCTALKNIYPKGKKDNQFYWADGPILIEKRLRLFFRKYGSDYANEDIIKATKMYVESFNGNTKYMKLLKYFIFKEEVKDNMTESTSELYTILEKLKQGESQEEIIQSIDWAVELK